MPVYDYHCADCDSAFAVRKRISEVDTPTECPDCGSSQTQRLISAVAIFTSGEDGRKRALAGGPSCSTCGLAATGCTSCRPR